MKITDLAKAIAPECSQKTVGIRPGEKIHETLIGEDEGRNTVEYNECFVIRQRLPDNAVNNGSKLCTEGFNYTSDNNPQHISVDELRRIIDQISDDYSIETSRWSMEDVPQ